ncbi:uncharacterized protein BT62DRAFT_925035 [Guyanagaster necrorhizus]|uniref:Uncharacterized protein n=1 Tax=Guyanagaster necrorhizus TaxID=856835 RepID=A0A9P8AZZ6_9AGAR|nr:uncharacterized protein BT62DRAFT_925035 [Guyanagaster necrorhizus MCA 3950]KAG7452482.1 hypothetical protein BT62DRAFT_925035 [Guyanagaster necrorhizus MCA 3950]
MFRSGIHRLAARRFYSSDAAYNVEALDKWIASRKEYILHDTLHPEHLSDLYITLPTRDGTRKAFHPPEPSTPMGYGHHTTFFYPRIPEAFLRRDGTDADFCPPEPFTRRMWAGGKISWMAENPLLIGGKATARMTIGSVKKKNFDRGRPIVFVNKKIEISMEHSAVPSVIEERVHVYLPVAATVKQEPREVAGIPDSSDFSFTYKPTLTTLFRFSALTFNAHHIHLDKDYARDFEGYRERLVHGPLTALMMLEIATEQNPGVEIKTFEYQATNPLIVNRKHTIFGRWTGDKAFLWCRDEDGVVGMTGTVLFG